MRESLRLQSLNENGCEAEHPGELQICEKSFEK